MGATGTVVHVRRGDAVGVIVQHARVAACDPGSFDAHVSGTDPADQTPVFGPCGPTCEVR